MFVLPDRVLIICKQNQYDRINFVYNVLSVMKYL